MRLTIAAGVALVLAACGQSDSDNVMASSANALTPAQVDLALGPELPNQTAAAGSDNAVQAADTEDALDETVPDKPESEPPTKNNGLEQ